MAQTGWHILRRSAFADNDIDFAILGGLWAPSRVWYQNTSADARFSLTRNSSGRPLLPDTHTPTPAREKSLNFFAFEQQQMGNWPINCSGRSRIADQCQKF